MSNRVAFSSRVDAPPIQDNEDHRLFCAQRIPFSSRLAQTPPLSSEPVEPVTAQEIL